MYPEDVHFTKNYRENHLYPREHRGYRDERNYTHGFYPARRSYFPRSRRMEGRPHKEPMPNKEEMDKALAEYMAIK